MRRLILVRHAKSSREDPSLADHERPLADRGITDARRAGKYLAEHLAPVDEVLCSTAARARETWALMGSALPEPPPVRFVRSLYLPTVSAIGAALRKARDDSKTMLLVGHDPSLEAFVRTHASSLSGSVGERLAQGIPTASLLVMELALGRFADFSRQRGQVTLLVTPDELTKKQKRAAPRPQKGERTEIGSDTTREQLASLAIGNAFEQMRANVPGARLFVDPEFVHQLRVGVRKLRVHVHLFRGLLGRRRAARLRQELTWFFRLLGVVRELDVFEESTLPALRKLGDARASRALERALNAEKARQHARFERALTGSRYVRLERELVQLDAELTHAARKGKKCARGWLRKRLDEHQQHVAAIALERDFADAHALHGLRKELKKFRYTAELARGAFAEEPTRAYLSGLSQLQDMLGAWNDSVMAEAWLGRLLPGARSRALATFGHALGSEREASVQGLAKALDQLAAAPAFWKE
jgi:phosphohistidine phosphatase